VRTLCLGEALVDLVCERAVPHLADADCFVPHAGGAVANAAVAAARCGGGVALAGGAGDDAWGEWLEARFEREGVQLDWFERPAGSNTPLAFVTVDQLGEPDFAIYGSSIPDMLAHIEPDLERAVESCDAVLLGSNSMVGERERTISLTARGLALRTGKPLLFDPNLRLQRWSDPREAISVVRSVCNEALLVKVNRAEGELITGEADPGDAAEAICELGATVAVVTLGADGAIARGAVERNVEGVAVDPVDSTGAGDVVTGVLVAALGNANFDPTVVGDALAVAVEAASRSTEGWGAIDSLPDPMPQFA
jgi:sugar/nucleoside kinase (ribokinase family)